MFFIYLFFKTNKDKKREENKVKFRSDKIQI